MNGARGTVVGFQPPSDTNGPSPAKRARLEAGSGNAGGGEPGWWPIVRFDSSGQELVLKPERWTAKSTAGEIVAGYEQVPLILAWAISIHKAQGSQYDWHVGTAPARPAVPPPLCAHPPVPPARPPARPPGAPLRPGLRALLAAVPPPPPPALPFRSMAVNVSGSFAAGQIYVALSRAKSTEGLFVTGFHRSHVKAAPAVAAFYERVAALQAVAPALASAGRARDCAAAPACPALAAPVASQPALPSPGPRAEAAAGPCDRPARQVPSGAAPATAWAAATPAPSFSQRHCSVLSAASPLPPSAAPPGRPPAVSPPAAPPPRRQQPPPPSSLQRQGPSSLAEAFGYLPRAIPPVAAASPSVAAIRSGKQEEAKRQWRRLLRPSARKT